MRQIQVSCRIDLGAHVVNIESIYDLGHIKSMELEDTEPFVYTKKN